MDAVMSPTRQRLERSDFALGAHREGSMHFEEESAVQKTLRRIAKRLDELGVPYAVVGGLAMFFHGYRRFTEDVDILVTPRRPEADSREAGRTRLPPAVRGKQAPARHRHRA